MLANARLQPLIWTDRLDEATAFYRDVLGLPVKATTDGTVVFDVAGTDLVLAPVPRTTPGEHTVMGFSVPDLAVVVTDLQAQGVTLERFPHFPQNDEGVLTTPDGSRVAWFRDPDGNLLSVVEYGQDQVVS